MYEDERPYEKCERFGPEHLTDSELLSVIIRTGTKGKNSLQLARQLLHMDASKEGLRAIHRWSLPELTKIKGIGRVKAIQLICLSELSKRMSRCHDSEKLDFSSPEKIADYYMEDLCYRQRELLKLLLLNTKMKLIHECNISEGTVDTALVSPRELFIEALQMGASFIILLHNHPSGDPTPSLADEQITQQIMRAGQMIGIQLLDHIIIGDHCFVSLKNKGVIN